MVVGIVGAVLVLILVIMLHEASHFLLARRFGMDVEEFFLGFGPKLWSTKRGNTEYGVKAIVAGGYVKIAGMDPFVEITEEERPRTFGAKPIWQRALVIFGGPATHFVLAFLALWAYFAFLGPPSRVAPEFSVVQVNMNGQVSPASQAGLQAGDQVLLVDGTPLSADELVAYTRDHVGEPIELTISRDGKQITTNVTPELAEVDGEEVGRLGVQLGAGDILERDPSGPFAGAVTAAQEIGGQGVLIVQAMGRVFGPEGIARVGQLVFSDAPREVTDPLSVVGAAKVSGQLSEKGDIDSLILLFVGLNLFVGMLNLIPLPPFDGGHLAALGIEKVRGRPVDMKKMIPVSAVVLVFFVTFGLLTVYLDVVKPISLP